MLCCLAEMLATSWPCRFPLWLCISHPPRQKGCCAPRPVLAGRVLTVFFSNLSGSRGVLDVRGGCAQGWNVLGNLLDLGKIAFAPASPAVLRLVDNLLSTHELMAE